MAGYGFGDKLASLAAPPHVADGRASHVVVYPAAEQPLFTDQVLVLLQQPDRPFTVIAYVTTSNQTIFTVSSQKLLRRARKEAAKLGGDAVIFRGSDSRWTGASVWANPYGATVGPTGVKDQMYAAVIVWNQGTSAKLGLALEGWRDCRDSADENGARNGRRCRVGAGECRTVCGASCGAAAAQLRPVRRESRGRRTRNGVRSWLARTGREGRK